MFKKSLTSFVVQLVRFPIISLLQNICKLKCGFALTIYASGDKLCMVFRFLRPLCVRNMSYKFTKDQFDICKIVIHFSVEVIAEELEDIVAVFIHLRFHFVFAFACIAFYWTIHLNIWQVHSLIFHVNTSQCY